MLMDEEEFFTEETNCDDFTDLTMEYDDYPEFDSVEYTTDW